jgi:curved DNA-binding protein
MPLLGDPKKRGDLFARVKLVLPEPLTDQEVESIRLLASDRQDSSKKRSK